MDMMLPFGEFLVAGSYEGLPKNRKWAKAVANKSQKSFRIKGEPKPICSKGDQE